MLTGEKTAPEPEDNVPAGADKAFTDVLNHNDIHSQGVPTKKQIRAEEGVLPKEHELNELEWNELKLKDLKIREKLNEPVTELVRYGIQASKSSQYLFFLSTQLLMRIFSC